MIFHIAVCSPDAGLRSGLERQCMEFFARRADACIVEHLPDTDALLRKDGEGVRYDLYLLELSGSIHFRRLIQFCVNACHCCQIKYCPPSKCLPHA